MTVIQSPQVEIQPDTLQAISECKNDKDQNETVWVHINSDYYRLKVFPKLLTDSSNGITMIQKRHAINEYNLKFKDEIEVSLVFPKTYHLFKFEQNFNFVSIASMNNKLILGTDTGATIKVPYPLSVNLDNVKILDNAHFSDIHIIKCFSSMEKYLTVGLDMQIKVWENCNDSDNDNNRNENHTQPLQILSGEHKSRISDILILGQTNVISSDVNGYLIMWNVKTGESIWKGRRIRSLNDSYNCMALYEEVGENETNKEQSDEDGKFGDCHGKILWCGHASGYISIWDLSSRLSAGEFLTNNLDLAVQKIFSIDKTTAVVGLSNGNLVKFEYDLFNKSLDKIWETNIEQMSESMVNFKQITMFQDGVFVLTDNYLARIDVKTGKTVLVFVGFDESINSFYIDCNYNELLVVGKRKSLVSFKL